MCKKEMSDKYLKKHIRRIHEQFWRSVRGFTEGCNFETGAGRVVGRDRFPPPRPADREAWFVISDDEPSSVQSIGRVHGATERRIPV